MKYITKTTIAFAMLYFGQAIAVEIPSEQDLVEIRSLRSVAEMHAKGMSMMVRIGEIRRSATKQDRCELDRRISTVLLDVPPTFGAEGVSITLRTEFVKMLPGFVALQTDARLWDALADHLHSASYVPRGTFDEKMKKAKEEDERLIAEGKIVRPPVRFAYPNTPNMAKVQREKWSAENWNTDISRYRLPLLKKYAPLLAVYFQELDEVERSQFRRRFTERARLSPKEVERFFGAVPERGNDANANTR